MGVRVVDVMFMFIAMMTFASSSPDCPNSSFFSTFPFLETLEERTPLRFRSQETSVIMQFAKFFNSNTPQLLQRMVKEKHVYLARKSVTHAEHLLALQLEDEGRSSLSEHSSSNSDSIQMHSLEQLVLLVRELLSLLLNDDVAMSGEEWASSCQELWWPISVDAEQTDLCWQLRCTACSAAVAAASAACQRTDGQNLGHKCLQKVMGEGFCNYCVPHYLA